jgi:hypothetical protein
VEGKINFTTARGTSFVLPKPGQGPGPLPDDVPPGKLRSLDVFTLTRVGGTGLAGAVT